MLSCGHAAVFLRVPGCPGDAGPGMSGSAAVTVLHAGSRVTFCLPPFKSGVSPPKKTCLWVGQGSEMSAGCQEWGRRAKGLGRWWVTHPQPPIPDFHKGEPKSSPWGEEGERDGVRAGS